MKSVSEIMENWETEQYNDWYALDEYINGRIIRLVVGDEETIKRKAADTVTGLNHTDSTGEPCEWGEDTSAERVPFFRCLLITAEEAKAHFDGIVEECPDWITQTEAAKLLGVSKGRVSQLARDGKLDTLGKLVSRTDVERRASEKPKAGRPW